MVRTEGAVGDGGRITVLGVDPADRRALAELPRWVPTDATELLRVPDAERWPPAERGLLANPPGAVLDLGRRLRGDRPDTGGLSNAVDAAAEECDVTVRPIESPSRSPVVPRSRLWSVAALTVTATSLLVPIAAIATFALKGGLLAGLLAVLVGIAAVALVVGFGYAHEAAAIRRLDASIATLVADDTGLDRGRWSSRGEHPVVVLPTRHAAGVAAALRESGIEAESRHVGEGTETPAAA